MWKKKKTRPIETFDPATTDPKALIKEAVSIQLKDKYTAVAHYQRAIELGSKDAKYYWGFLEARWD